MGRPKDKRERLVERAQADLQRALSRHDCSGAAEHLLQLPRELRGDQAAELAPLVAAEVRRAYATGELGRLSLWAARVEEEPRLLCGGPGAHDSASAGTLYALLLGALRAREYPRAGRLLGWLAPTLSVQAPALLAWLQALVDHRGALPADVVAALPPLPGPAQPDPRLGYDPVGPRERPAAPRGASQIDGAVAALLAHERAPLRLKDTLLQWHRELPMALRPQLGLAAAPGLLSLALQQRAAGRSIDLTISTLVELNNSAPAALQPDLLLALRLSVSRLSTDAGGTSTAPAAWLQVTRLALAYPELRDLAEDLLIESPLAAAQATHALPVLAALLGHRPTARGVARALGLWHDVLAHKRGDDPEGLDPAAQPAPPWLQEAAEATLRDGSLAQLLRDDAGRRRRLLQQCGLFLSVPLNERLITAAHPLLDEAGRHELGTLLMRLGERLDSCESDAELLQRARASGFPVQAATFADLMERCRELEELPPPDVLAEVMQAPPERRLPREMHGTYASLCLRSKLSVSLPARALLQRFGALVLPDQAELLPFLLSNSEDAAAQEALVARYLSVHDSLQGHLDLIKVLDRPPPHLCEWMDCLLQRMMERYHDDGEALARGLQRAETEHMHMLVRRRLAQRILVLEARGQGPSSALFASALVLARQTVPSIKPRPRGTRAPTPASEAEAPAAARRGRPTKAQQPVAATPAPLVSPASEAKRQGRRSAPKARTPDDAADADRQATLPGVL